MIDSTLNVSTHDLNYTPYRIGKIYYLPGKQANSTDEMAKSAHQNVIKVATFIRDVLERQGIDNKGLNYLSTVKCVGKITEQEWRNACWIPTKNQVVYGQQLIDNNLVSYAASLEIVAHEIFHGITSHTAKLESREMSGALNESYSDILAVIILNWNQPDISQWNWEIGRPYGECKQPLRSLQMPSKYGQPEHMRKYHKLLSGEKPDKDKNDKGWIHENCGIHNKAAYNLLNSINEKNEYLLTPQIAANLFYQTLLKLTAKSNFSDSKAELITTTGIKFKDNLEQLIQVVEAINQAFDKVGIE